jgi:hypothetical protein
MIDRTRIDRATAAEKAAAWERLMNTVALFEFETISRTPDRQALLAVWRWLDRTVAAREERERREAEANAVLAGMAR